MVAGEIESFETDLPDIKMITRVAQAPCFIFTESRTTAESALCEDAGAAIRARSVIMALAKRL